MVRIFFFFWRGRIGSGFQFAGNPTFMRWKSETRQTSVPPNWNPTASSQSWVWKEASTTETCPSVTEPPLGRGILAPFYSRRNGGTEGLSVDTQLKVTELGPNLRPYKTQSMPFPHPALRLSSFISGACLAYFAVFWSFLFSLVFASL